jgi:secreted trypsin-like serine protease
MGCSISPPVLLVIVAVLAGGPPSASLAQTQLAPADPAAPDPAAAPGLAAADDAQAASGGAASAPPSQVTTGVSDGSRIVGGYDAPRGKRPWQAEIKVAPNYLATGKAKYSAAELARAPLWNWTHLCGGVLIAPGWIVTAAHCVTPRQQAKGLTVQLGTQDLRRPGWFFKMDRILINHLWSFEGGPEDIALVHLTPDADAKRPPGPPTYRPIPVAGFARDFDPSARGDSVLVTGWGRTSDDDPNAAPARPGAAPKPLTPVTPPILKEVRLSVVDTPSCRQAFPDADLSGALCAAGAPAAPGAAPKDSCNGDSGGPMIRERSPGDFVLVGLVSWGAARCGSKPGVYTGVEYYTAWFRQQMGADVALLAR